MMVSLCFDVLQISVPTNARQSEPNPPRSHPMQISQVVLVIACVIVAAGPVPAVSQDSSFSYQDFLTDGFCPASGNYDFRFRIFSTPDAGDQISNAVTSVPVVVSNGVFTVAVDFGATAFDGNSRWLEIGVRTNGSQLAYTTVSPRQ